MYSGQASLPQLLKPARYANVERRGQENLEVGVRTDDGADVPAIEDGPRGAVWRCCRKGTLKGQQSRAHGGNGGNL